MDESILDLAVEKLNLLCSSGRWFPNVLSVRGELPDKLVFETVFGQTKGSVQLEDDNLIMTLGNQKVTIPISDFLGKSN